MPNRRRRKLSTAMSAVAALAVASPCAYFLVYESTESNKPPQHHEFKQAAVITDLPGELMGALTQGLSQFGINLPPVPALSGTSATSTGRRVRAWAARAWVPAWALDGYRASPARASPARV